MELSSMTLGYRSQFLLSQSLYSDVYMIGIICCGIETSNKLYLLYFSVFFLVT